MSEPVLGGAPLVSEVRHVVDALVTGSQFEEVVIEAGQDMHQYPSGRQGFFAPFVLRPERGENLRVCWSGVALELLGRALTRA